MSSSPILDRIEKALQSRRDHDLLRSVAQYTSAKAIDLSTNSYLALETRSSVLETAKTIAGGILYGNLASRLVAAKSPLFVELENEIAAWKKTDSALIFNSGYAANAGIIQSLCTRSTELFCDRLNHASILDGASLSGCKLIRYRHNDMADLRARLAISRSPEKLIATDSVFSMDGDRAPLGDICELAQQYGCMVMVDEAHATGILGSSASGLVEESGMSKAVDIRMGTLSKAVGGMGGFFAGSRMIRDYLVNSARSLIYSTALPHAVLAFDLAAIRHIRTHPEEGRRLLETARQFTAALSDMGYETLATTTQIVPCVTQTAERALSLHSYLKTRGIIAPAIRPPTVPADTARVRFSLHAGLDQAHLDTVLAALAEWIAHD